MKIKKIYIYKLGYKGLSKKKRGGKRQGIEGHLRLHFNWLK